MRELFGKGVAVQSPVRRGHDRNRSIPSKGAAREEGAPHPNLVPAEGRSFTAESAWASRPRVRSP